MTDYNWLIHTVGILSTFLFMISCYGMWVQSQDLTYRFMYGTPVPTLFEIITGSIIVIYISWLIFG